jgi:hypothetical protein
MEGSHATPYEPRDSRVMESSSNEPTLPTLRPRASWMIDDGDERTEAQADADWHRANEWMRAPPPTSIRSSSSSIPTPITPTPTPIMPTPPLPHLGAPNQPWGDGPPHIATPPIAQGWQLQQWAAHEGEPEPEPQAWGSRRSYSDDDDDPPPRTHPPNPLFRSGGHPCVSHGFCPRAPRPTQTPRNSLAHHRPGHLF